MNLQEIRSMLYETNEYGVEHQKVGVKLPPKATQYLETEYGIPKSLHDTCVNCQARQAVKYGKGFAVRCEGIKRSLSVSAGMLKEISQMPEDDQKRSMLLLKATEDPVAWAELMLNFTDESEEWHLRGHQKESLRCNALRQVDRWGRRSGKALPLNTLLPTPTGWTTMGDVEEGDYVFDENGQPTKVLFATEVMHNHDCYKLTFDDGSEMVADAEHQWRVLDRKGPREVVTTQLRVGHEIPLAKPLEYSGEEVVLKVKALKDGIPEAYLLAPVWQRQELLSMLLADPRLFHLPSIQTGLYQLATGLGYKVFFTSSGLQLKKGNRRLVGIEKTRSVPVRCISVAADSQLYLAGAQCLVTHNTFIYSVKLLHHVFTKVYRAGTDSEGRAVETGPSIMIVTPYQIQLTNIFNEIEKLLKRNTELANQVTTGSSGSLYVKSPNYRMEFSNGAKIEGFVSGTGVKTDGSGGGSIRGASAHIVYLDEMDMIPDEILDKVVQPILLTTKGVILYATSTPIGKRGKFYKYCLEDKQFRENHFPSSVLSHWDEIKESIRGDSTADAFDSEYMAIFLRGGHGVFKPEYIYGAMMDYSYSETDRHSFYQAYGLDRSKMFISMGIDWNKNAGSEFAVCGYDPSKHEWFVLETTNVSASEYSSVAWKQEVVRLNYKWKPDYIYADEGYGHTIIEDLKLLAYDTGAKIKKNAMDLETEKLRDRLVAFNFSSNVELRNPVEGTLFKKAGKQFLVENTVRIMEDGRLSFSLEDKTLFKQLGSYVVLKMNATGKPIYGSEDTRLGDHRLDAVMLALGALSLEFGIYAKNTAPMSAPKHVDLKLGGSAPEKGPPSVADLIKSLSGKGPQGQEEAMREFGKQYQPQEGFGRRGPGTRSISPEKTLQSSIGQGYTSANVYSLPSVVQRGRRSISRGL